MLNWVFSCRCTVIFSFLCIAKLYWSDFDKKRIASHCNIFPLTNQSDGIPKDLACFKWYLFKLWIWREGYHPSYIWLRVTSLCLVKININRIASKILYTKWFPIGTVFFVRLMGIFDIQMDIRLWPNRKGLITWHRKA